VTSLPGARLLPRRSFSNRYIRSLLRPARPERFPYQLTASPSYHSHPSFLLSSQSHVHDIHPNFFFSFVFFFNTISLRFLLSLSHTTMESITPWVKEFQHLFFHNTDKFDILRYRNQCLNIHPLNQLTRAICLLTTIPSCYPIFIPYPIYQPPA
jgi:hypothetical protein